ncbi:MAG: hypothetical protein K2N71_10995 [Oscillospiraceae bacterium]|nr:hypothetical protein [Oscillospiraceae bacterium]
MKKLLCTLFAAAVVAAMSAVTAFAEDNLIFIKTASTPKEVTEFAEKEFKEHPHRAYMLESIGLTEEQQKTAQLGSPIIAKGIYDDEEDFTGCDFPIICDGKFTAFMSVSIYTDIGFTMGKMEFEDKLNKLVTSPAMPAEIYAEGDKFGTTFAAVGDEVIVLRNMFNEDKSKQIGDIKKLRSEDNFDEDYVINVYGYSKTGWITVDGSKYFIRKNGTLATGNLTIGGKRYKFDENGKYLGTFTGFVRSGGKRCYYKDGVKQTGDFTVNGKPYRTDKNGNILTEEKPVYVKTAPVPEEAAAFAKDIFEHLGTYDLTSIGLTKAEAKSAKLGSPFVITSLSSGGKPVDAAECYYCPILCSGEAKAFLIVHKDDNGKFGWQLGIEGIEEKFNSLDTSHDDPAEIYYVDGICIAATNSGMTVLSNVSNYDASPQTAALEKLRNKNASGDYVINVYGNSKVSV